MTPTEYQVALVRLLAETDQHAAAALDEAFNPDLTREQREFAVVQLQFRRYAVELVESMLGASSPSRER